MDLAELGALYGTDKLDHGYLPRYEQHLGGLRHHPIRLLEIGVHRGASLRMWRDWFDRAQIIGVDTLAHCQVTGEPRITTYVADAARDTLALGLFDVIVDDGSHQAGEIDTALRKLWPDLSPGGWYVIEDLETQWLQGWGGGQFGSGAIATIHHHVNRVLGGMVTGDWGVHELHAYEQIVFIRKGFPA